MNVTIYLATIRKILRHRLIAAMLFFMGIIVPSCCAILPASYPVEAVNGWDGYTTAVLGGLIVVTASNCIGSTLSVGGRSDYMPLLMTRPMPRFHYVTSKWLALSTVIGAVSLSQHLILLLTGSFAKWTLTPEMIACDFLERIVATLCVSSVLTLIYLLPTQNLVLSGIIAFELAMMFNVLSLTFVIPLSATSADLSSLVLEILGVDHWLKDTLMPAIFGANAGQSISQYTTVCISLANFLSPNLHPYDLMTARPFMWSGILEAASNVLLALTLATLVLNAREYHYDSD